MGQIVPFNPWRRFRPDTRADWLCTEVWPAPAEDDVIEVRNGETVRRWRWLMPTPSGTHWRRASA